MNNDELKQTLLEQKVPMNIAVAKKLAYLESDDVFSKDNPNYIGFSLKPMVKDDNGSVLKDAFLSLQATSVPKENINPPTMSINTYQKTQETSQRDFVETPSQSVQQQPVKPMSMAQRIAALRGAMVMPQEYKK